MYNFFKQCSLFICALISLGVFTGSVNAQERKVTMEQFHWYGEAPKGKLVKVINPYGSVTSRSSMASGIELSGVIQKIGDNPPQHTIKVEEIDGVLEVVVSYPKDSIRNTKGELTGRFDIGVWLPSWARLDIETDFGDIKVKKSASDVTAKSNTGKIAIGTSGHVEALSEKGNISVSFYGERFRKTMNIVSRFGDVKVDMSQDTRLILKASAANKIINNFAKYKAIEVSGDNSQLSARITKPTKHKIKAVELNLAANNGSLAIRITDDVSRKIDKTPPSFLTNGESSKTNTNKSNKGGQSSVKSDNQLAAG